MNDYLSKPIEPALLCSKLLRWIPARPQSQARPPLKPLPVTDAELEALRIEGLDSREGLRRCGGKPAFYRSMLAQFVDHWRQAGADLRRMLDELRWEEAHRFAHSLKGVAGSLGALEVQVASQQLERCLQAFVMADAARDMEALAVAIENLERQLGPLILAIQAALPQPEAEPGAIQARERPLGFAELRERLLAMLETGDTDAIELVFRHAGALQLPLGRQYDEFARAVRDFDFDKARQVLDLVEA